MRTVDDEAIRTHGAVRFRSAYHYAVFEYWRSAKVLRYLERRGVTRFGRALDDGCGGGGMTVSFAEESDWVAGIDLSDGFATAGVVLAREQGVRNVSFATTDGQALPFRDRVFDTVLSHAVIEHVADPLVYLREIRRVLKPGGLAFLQAAPYLAPSGSHLPRLKVRVPYYLFLGRRASFRLARWLAAHVPRALDAPPDGSSFLTSSRRGEVKRDDLLYRVTVRNLRRNIAAAGFRVIHEDVYFSGLAKRVLPGRLVERVPAVPFVRDILVTDMNYLLRAD